MAISENLEASVSLAREALASDGGNPGIDLLLHRYRQDYEDRIEAELSGKNRSES